MPPGGVSPIFLGHRPDSLLVKHLPLHLVVSGPSLGPGWPWPGTVVVYGCLLRNCRATGRHGGSKGHDATLDVMREAAIPTVEGAEAWPRGGGRPLYAYADPGRVHRGPRINAGVKFALPS